MRSCSVKFNFNLYIVTLFPHRHYIPTIRLEGTPAYMPPEMLRGDREWRRDQGNSGGLGLGAIYEDLSDSWALGCLASFCLHGRPLYVGTAEEVTD